MKLVLANNQSERFVQFYRDLQARSVVPFDYAGYNGLLFTFDPESKQSIDVLHIQTGRHLQEYESVYINGYQEVYAPHAKSTDLYELAASVAIASEYLGVRYVNQEMNNPPSLSKLSMHAKLAANGIRTPVTHGGSKQAILAAKDILKNLEFPLILKRANADRGIDNFKVNSWQEIDGQLDGHDDTEVWLLQEFIPNDGFYLVSFYGAKPVFGIFRAMEERPDGSSLKSHFYKPKGGANASLLEVQDVPKVVLHECQAAINTANRQIGSVDCLYDPITERVYVLEVNYNPQLVTIETFKDARQQAFLDALENL